MDMRSCQSIYRVLSHTQHCIFSIYAETLANENLDVYLVVVRGIASRGGTPTSYD